MRVILGYIASTRPAWAALDPDLRREVVNCPLICGDTFKDQGSLTSVGTPEDTGLFNQVVLSKEHPGQYLRIAGRI